MQPIVVTFSVLNDETSKVVIFWHSLNILPIFVTLLVSK